MIKKNKHLMLTHWPFGVSKEVVNQEPAKAEIKQPDENKTYYADAIAAVERVRKAIAAELKAKSKKARKSNATTEASPRRS
jgi:hypothetical protein